MNSTIQNIYFRSDQAKAYTLLSPALILVIFAMVASNDSNDIYKFQYSNIND